MSARPPRAPGRPACPARKNQANSRVLASTARPVSTQPSRRGHRESQHATQHAHQDRSQAPRSGSPHQLTHGHWGIGPLSHWPPHDSWLHSIPATRHGASGPMGHWLVASPPQLPPLASGHATPSDRGPPGQGLPATAPPTFMHAARTIRHGATRPPGHRPPHHSSPHSDGRPHPSGLPTTLPPAQRTRIGG
jgi:hypothetical protein